VNNAQFYELLIYSNEFYSIMGHLNKGRRLRHGRLYVHLSMTSEWLTCKPSHTHTHTHTRQQLLEETQNLRTRSPLRWSRSLNFRLKPPIIGTWSVQFYRGCCLSAWSPRVALKWSAIVAEHPLVLPHRFCLILSFISAVITDKKFVVL
jgi:hypothetical protein